MFLDTPAFEGLVSSLLEREEAASFGRLHMVSILPVEDGGNHAALSPKAVAIAEGILKNRLGTDDACLRMGPGKYMLLFPRLGETEGHVRAAAIAHQIREHLFGQSGIDLDVSVQVMRLDRLKGRPRVDTVTHMDEVLTRAGANHGLDLDVVFQPVWSADANAVIGNRARIRRHFNGIEMFEAETLFAGENDPLAKDVNHLLRRAASSLCAAPGVDMFVPQAINDHAMTDVAAITENVRNARCGQSCGLVIELAGAVSSVSRPRLRDTIGAIAAGGAKVAVRSIPDLDTARFLRDCGTEYLCVNEAQVKLAGLTPSAVMALITVLSHEVRDLGYQLCLWNASSGDIIKRAAGLGYALFSGPPVGHNTARPVAPHGFAASRIYV